ncbi:MAG: diguanylate cyclase [Trichlorobacter sp.]|uniref:diguanylate cyclase n=1 Tax=Trichlorobacter sp. TaxID=2911007 RepID=UPI002562D4BA|nr:diguanylate cyclase [Trichlorobacter sp.]MDK9716574.1 diguanylate cyclase [Trichlorobacter sp.]
MSTKLERSSQYRIRQHWLAFFVALALLGSIVTYNLVTIRQRAISQEHQRLMTQVRVIGQNIERQLESTNLALKGVVADLPGLQGAPNLVQANKRLSVLADAMPGVRTLFFTDATGTILASNRPELIGRNIATRQYFSEPKQHPTPDTLYISPPFRSVLNAYVFNITKILSGPDGRFNGIVTVGVDPDYFAVILQSTLYAPDMWNTINHGDGIRFMTMPYREGQTGKNLAVPGSLFTRHKESGKPENIFTGTAYATGKYRLAALLTVQPKELQVDKPLVLIISRDPDAILSDWQNEAIFQGLLFLVACIASAAGLALLHRRQDLFEQKAQRAEAMVQIRYELLEYATMHTADELLQYALDEVCRISASPVGFYHFVDPDQQTLTLQAWSTRTLQEFCKAEGHGMHYGVDQAGVWAECIQTRAPAIHNDYAGLPNKKGLPPGHAPVIRELVVPVIRDERIVAVLGVGNKQINYTTRDAEEVAYLADVTWEIIDGRRAQQELKRANELLATEARIDYLTGIYNRRMFDGLMTAEIARSYRYNSLLSLIMMDIDHFKQVNDNLGHAAGDHVLQKIAELISGRIRGHDIFSRWGGEEFVIMAPKNDRFKAAELAEILREVIEQFDFGNGLRITLSFGVTQYCYGEQSEEFVARADAALYQAKHKGRNRVEIAAPPVVLSQNCVTEEFVRLPQLEVSS